jgi:DNA-directed RNA polymerase specialized sigma24 family protein
MLSGDFSTGTVKPLFLEMTKDQLNEEAFNKLLDWLSPEREVAAETYNRIQIRLIRIFSANGCGDPETLTNETFDRILSKIDWLTENYVGDPLRYFCTVARNIIKEDYRERVATRAVPPVNPVDEDKESELQYQCLDECMEKLSRHGQRLLISYYEEQGNKKIVNRRKLAGELGITLTALRLRVFHMRTQLKICIEICLHNRVAHETL